MNQPLNSRFEKTPEALVQREAGYLNEANVDANSNAPVSHLSLISVLNGPGVVAAPRALPTASFPPSLGHGLFPPSLGHGLDSTSSFLATGETSTLWGSQHQVVSQYQNQLLQVLLQQQRQKQQQEEQQALLAAVMTTSRIAPLPTVSSSLSSHQLATLGSTLAASSQLAKAQAPANPVAETKQQQQLHYYSDTTKLPDPSSDEDNDDEEGSGIKDAGDASAAAKEKFPYKLYRMLEEAEKNGDESIVSFFPHGKAFAVHKPRDFVTDLMPKYFTTTRMSSFQRQLNLYGFQRITEGRDKGGYFHEFFLQGRKGLCKKILRKKNTLRTPPELAEVGKVPGALANQGGVGNRFVTTTSRGGLDHVILAQINQQNILQRRFAPNRIPGSTADSIFGLGEHILPGMGNLGAVAGASRLVSEMVSIERSRSDLLSRLLRAQTNPSQTYGAEVETDVASEEFEV